MAAIVRKRGGYPQKGQALVELALVTPLLLALVLGVIELGRYAYTAILVGNAAHAGATYGAQGLAYCAPPRRGIDTAAKADFGSDGNLSVSSTVSCGCDNGLTVVAAPDCSAASVATCDPSEHWVVTVSVATSAPFQPLFKYPLTGPVTVTGKATMRVAQQ